MKYITIIILLTILLPLSLQAGMHGDLEAGVLASQVTNEVTEDRLQTYTKINIFYPIQKFRPFVAVEIWSNPNALYSYAPYNSSYAIGLSYALFKNTDLILKHECSHPVVSEKEYKNINTWLTKYTMLSFKIKW